MFAFVIAPDGATSEYTDRMLQEMERILAETEEVDLYGAIVAPGFSGPGLANNAVVFLRLKDERERSVQEIVNGPGGLAERFFGEIEGAIAIPNIPKTINRSFDAPFRLVLQAPDLEQLDEYARDLSNRLRQEGFLGNVRSSFEINKPEVRLKIDRDRAATLGVSVRDISETLQVLFGGLDLSKIKKDGKEYDVIAQLRRSSRLIPRQLDHVYVRNNKGDLVQLSNVLQREVGVSPNVIERYNRIRSATISGTPINLPIGTAVKKVEAVLAETLPPGFLYEWQGESKDFRDAGQEIRWVLVLALIIVYMVLASQFESLTHPFTVMMTVPLAGVGAVGLLWFLKWLGDVQMISPIPAMNINLFSQIGLILLVGLVTKNGILLVEFANQIKETGVSTREAMIRSGLVRLRPILMTAVSTISGILPIAIGFGAGAESRRPMGVVVVGGMLTSTVLTLFVIPTVYTVIGDLLDWRRKKKELV
jgi:multidrug efflux pump subunit AcrB